MKNPLIKLIVSLLLLTSGLSTSAQSDFSDRFLHSYGLGAYFGGSVGCPALIYSPRLTISQPKENVSFSIGSHTGVGYYGSFSSNSNASYQRYMVDLPLVAELNYGFASTNDATDQRFGLFLGGGFGYSFMAYESVAGTIKNEATGFYTNFGVRAKINGYPLGLRFSYLTDLHHSINNVVGISFFGVIGTRFYD